MAVFMAESAATTGLIEWPESQGDGSTVCCGRPSMTTPAKASSAADVLPRRRFRVCLLAAWLALAVPLVGCHLFTRISISPSVTGRQIRCRSL
jgi:hypothetical protein